MDSTLKNTETIIDSIFKQATNGFIKIGDDENGFWPYYIKFYQRIEGNMNFPLNETVPIVQIPNYKNFVKCVDNYLKIAREFYLSDQEYFNLNNKSFDEKLFMDLFISATNYNFNNIEQYIELKKEMLQTPVKRGKFVLRDYQGLHVLGSVRKLNSNLEGPYRFKATFVDDEKNNFNLPGVTFGIVGDTAYVYAVQNKPQEPNIVSKKLDRYFRKLNKNVPEEQQNVSPNALASFTIFCSYLQSIGITQIQAPNFMPIRYEANKEASLRHLLYPEDQLEYIKKHDHDQYNITNKFMYLLNRYSLHFDSCETNYNDITQQMHLTLRPSEPKDDNIIYELSNVAKKRLNTQQEPSNPVM